MIQESINQLLNTAAIAGRLSPSYEESQEAKSAIGKAKIAQAGLEDISKNLQDPKKEYSATELADIKSRVAEHNRNVYTAKTLGESNPYAKKGASELPSQSVYSPMLKDIESNLEKREMALQRMKERGQASIDQDQDFKNYKNSIILDSSAKPIKKEA